METVLCGVCDRPIAITEPGETFATVERASFDDHRDCALVLLSRLRPRVAAD